MNKFHEFVENPTGVLYVEALAELAGSPGYSPYDDDSLRIHELITSEKFEAAQEACRDAMETLLLSPEAHMIAAFLARKLDDKELLARERLLIAACITGILDTGDGTKQHPYVVSVVSDEYSVLRALKKEMTSQCLIRDEDRFLDVIETIEKERIYFDITVPYSNLQRRMSNSTSNQPDVEA
jgi:hypothetical protein